MIFFLAKIQTMECVESGNEVWFRVMLWIVCLGRKCYCFVHLILYTIIETHQILVDWLVLFMCKSMSKLAPWAGLCRDRGPCPLKLKYIYIYIYIYFERNDIKLYINQNSHIGLKYKIINEGWNIFYPRNTVWKINN